jgi:hypothetical protein
MCYLLITTNCKQIRGVSGLFIGVRASLLNAILPFGNWYLLGVPFLVKTRRMVSHSYHFICYLMTFFSGVSWAL